MNQIKAGAVLNYVIIGLNILTGLLYTPYMLHCLGQNEYGLYSIVASVIAYLTLLDFGFGSAITRYSARTIATGIKAEEWRLYGMFISAYTLIGILVSIVGVVLYFNIDNMFDRTMTDDEIEQAKIMMGLMVLNLAATFPLSVFGSIVNAYEKFVFQRVINIARIILSTLTLVFVLSIGYKAVAMVVIQTIFSIGTLIANWLYCKYRLKIKIIFRDFNYILLKEIIFFSWWNFVGAIVDRLYWNTGQFILGIYCGTVAVAIYSVAFTLFHLYLSMSTALNSVLLPRITVLATDKNNDKHISDLFIKTGRLQFCVLCLILCGFILFGKAFIQLWAGQDYEQSFFVALLFFVATFVPLIQNVGLSVIMARGKLKFRSMTYFVISIVTVLGEILVAQQYGVLGCAWAIAIAHIIGQWIIMNLYYKNCQHIEIGMFWKNIFQMIKAPFIITSIAAVALYHLHIDSWLKLIIGIILFLCIYLPIFWKSSMNGYEKSLVLGCIRKLQFIK